MIRKRRGYMKKVFKTLLAAAGLSTVLAITAFADGWTMENGQWTYYENGYRVTNDWRLSADGGYYYLGSNGYMVTNTFVNDERYVDNDGKMVTNGWRQINGKWYYFDNNGQLITNRSRQINGLWYFFDYDGSMMTGWVEDNGSLYYCDPEAGGRMVTATWRYIAPPEEYIDYDDDGPYSADGKYWFYFLSSGKVCKSEDSGEYRQMVINNSRYAFDDIGRMQTGWVKVEDTTPAIAGYRYFNDSDSIGTYGAAHQGWLSAYPPEGEGYMGNVYWYYFDSKGQPYYGTDVSDSDDDETLEAKFRRLEKDGKTETYLFNEYGNPVYGLRKVRRSNGDVTSMYFGTQQECCLQKGDRNITDAEGNSYTFHFDSSGYGYTGVKNGKLYYMGLLQRAIDSSYAYYTVNGTTYLVNKSGNIRKNYNSNKEEADFKSDSQGRWMEGAYEEPSELLTPVFEISYI